MTTEHWRQNRKIKLKLCFGASVAEAISNLHKHAIATYGGPPIL